MASEDQNPDFESKCKELEARVNSLTTTLNEYIDSNNQLKADLEVQRLINRKTVGASSQGAKSDTGKVSLADKIAKLRKGE